MSSIPEQFTGYGAVDLESGKAFDLTQFSCAFLLSIFLLSMLEGCARLGKAAASRDIGCCVC